MCSLFFGCLFANWFVIIQHVIGHQRQVSLCDSASLHYGLGMAFLAVAAPSLPCLFGVTALFLR